MHSAVPPSSSTFHRRPEPAVPKDVSGAMLEEVEQVTKGWYWAPSQTAEQLRWDHFTPSK